MSSRPLFWPLACLPLLAGPALAQDPATLTAAAAATAPVMAANPALPTRNLAPLTELVLQHTPGLQAARQASRTAAAGGSSAGALPTPRLEWLGGSHRSPHPGEANGRVSSWGVAQPLENPALRQARLASAQSNERNSLQQVRRVRGELVAQVRRQAFEHLVREAEAQAAADALALLEQVRTRVRVRVDSGEAARYEIIKADAEIVQARQRQQHAALQAEQAMLALQRLAAGQLPARWRLAASLDQAPPLPTLDDIRQLVLSDNPELLVLQAEVARAQAQQDAARAGRWPGLELSYTRLRDPESRQGLLGVSVQIPLLDQRQGPMAEAASERLRAEGLLAGRRAELQQEVLLAWKSLEMARLRSEALSQGAVREAEAALRVAEAAYRFGERGILDVLDAQRLLRSVRADLLDARFQVQAAHTELDRLAGRYADAPTAP